MQVLPRLAAIAGLLALAAGGTVSSAQHILADRNAPAYVYVNDNTAAGNTVAGYSENADGSLTVLPGSPFAVGGAGLGKGLGSQDAIQVTPDDRFLLVADGGSNQISVLTIQPGGGLLPVANSPFASGGVQPVSIAVHGPLVYVANDGSAISSVSANYAGFFLNGAGQLSPVTSAPVQVPGAANDLGDVLFSGDGTHLIGVEVADNLIDSFMVNRQGGLTPASGSPFTAQGAGPFGSAFRPTNPSQLFVSNAHNGALLGTVSAFHVAWNGALTSIGTSPFADQQAAPCWVAISPDGQYLFTANTGSGSISSYAINFDGSLSLLGDLPMAGTGPAPLDLRVDPSGRNLYGIDNGPKAVSMVHLHDGYMLASPTSPMALPAGATPSGITVAGIAQGQF